MIKRNQNILRAVCAATLLGGVTLAMAAPRAAWAQATPPNVTLDLQDAPIRAALEQIFRSAKVDFGIDPTVQGYVNLKVTDIPFENALRLILRSSTTPLTYTKEGGVYLVKPRALDTGTTQPPAPEPGAGDDVRQRANFEQIELTYVDPADLAQLLGVTILRVGVRQPIGQGGGGQGGGFGGGGGLGGGGGFGGGGFGGGGGLGGGGFGGGFGGGRGF